MWSLTQLREFLDSQEFAQQNETAAEFKKTNKQNDEDLSTNPR